MLLQSKGLTKKFGAKTAVNGITLDLEVGHVYGLLGPNGSGKTTWMKMVAGLVKPTAGEVLFDGKPIGLDSRKQIAYMSTEPYFYNWMKIIDAGKYYADFFEDFSMEEYLKLLDSMELSGNMKITSLSTGMTAKMKIAVTMARNARVWMLDEPFNGIDLLARDAIRNTILARRNENNMLLLSSHLVEEMEAIVDRTIFIREGSLAEVKSLEELYAEGTNMSDRYRALYGHTEEA